MSILVETLNILAANISRFTVTRNVVSSPDPIYEQVGSGDETTRKVVSCPAVHAGRGRLTPGHETTRK